MLKQFQLAACMIILSLRAAYAQPIVTFKYSKPFALLKFLETARRGDGCSRTFCQQIDTAKALQGQEFREQVNLYQSLNLNYNYSKQNYPEKRKHTTSTFDLICIAAISSETNEAFFERIIGILPNEDYMKLKQVFTTVQPYYDAFIYTRNEEAIRDRINRLNTLSSKANELFGRFRQFYGSSWDKSIPFSLAIYPIYGQQGETTATPHANSLELGFLLDSKDDTDLAAIGMHEMCHVLFEEQPLRKQQAIDSVFTAGNDPYFNLAYRYIDEALATALGNGYAYKSLSGHLDSSEWYNDNYINRYAKAIYPTVGEYLNADKTMDEAFVEQAIAIFRKTFPEAPYDIDASMMQSDAYFEDDEAKVVNDMMSSLRQTFRIYRSNTSVPINDPTSIEYMDHSDQAQIFVIHRNQAQNLALLKTKFKKLKGLPKEKNIVAAFLDDKNRPVFVIVAENKDKAIEGIKVLKAQGRIDRDKWWRTF